MNICNHLVALLLLVMGASVTHGEGDSIEQHFFIFFIFGPEPWVRDDLTQN